MQMQKYQFIDLQEQFGKYCSTLSVCGLNSDSMIPIFVKKRDFEPTVINNAN